MVGNVFFLFAAWYLCGLLGAPTFALRPELMAEYGTQSSAASLGSLIAVYLVLGWGFTFFAHHLASRTRSESEQAIKRTASQPSSLASG